MERRWPDRIDAVATTGRALLRVGRWADAAERMQRARDPLRADKRYRGLIASAEHQVF